MAPFFSIVIPLYNKEKHIKKTLQSVLNQTYNSFEVIVVNDGSTDNSVKIVESFNDDRIKIISIENSGVSQARNTGIENASAEYIAFLDADDLWEKDFLEHFKENISKFRGYHLFSCAEKIKHGSSNTLLKYKYLPKDIEIFTTNYFKASYMHSILHGSNIIITKEAIGNIGLFDVTLKTDEDTDYWIRAGLLYDVVFSKVALAIHTTDSNDLTRSKRLNYKSLDYWKYIDKSENVDFKSFLNNNIYSSLLKYKLTNNQTEFKNLIKLLNYELLNDKQNIILKTPSMILKILIRLQSLFTKGKSYY